MAWPCSSCGAVGTRNIGTRGYCGTHLAELFSGFAPEVFANAGVGIPCGSARPDLGPAVLDLRCNACDATWAGLTGDPCWWCERSRQNLVEWQAELVLRRPDVDPSDERHGNAMLAWADRLTVAVEADIVTRQQAERVLRREMRHAA